MGETSNRRYPYPETSAVPNVPADLEALAKAVDTDVKNVSATADAALPKVNPTATGALTVPEVRTPAVVTSGHLKLYSNGGQVECWNGGSLATVACGDASYANQAVTLGQMLRQNYLYPNGTFFGDLRTSTGHMYARHTDWFDPYSLINVESGNGKYALKSSSAELKEDVETLSPEVAADLFAAIRPVSFRYKTTAEHPMVPEVFSGQQHVGFVAEEVRDAGVATDVMGGDGDNPKLPALEQSNLLAILWAKVQQQDTQIAELTARLDALESA